jgi:hypothetical protein
VRQSSKKEKIPGPFLEFMERHWIKILHGIFFLIVVPAALILAHDWVKTEVKRNVAEDGVKQQIIKNLKSDFVSLAFPSHFILSDDVHSLEQFIPIYVGNHKSKVDLFITVSHQGPQNQPLRQIEVSIDSERVDIDGLNREPRFKKNISLTSAIEKARKSGAHDFNDQIYTIGFRADPTQQTKDSVSISALIVAHGIDKEAE